MSKRYQTFPRGGVAALACRALRVADGLGLPASDQAQRRGLWAKLPRSAAVKPEGPKRLALSFDLDYQADTDVLPDLVDLLGRAGARATLFSIGRLVEQDPGPYRAALAAGHEIANHTYSHPDNPVLDPGREFRHLGVDEMTRQIGEAQNALELELGVRPTGFRTPHFKDAYRMVRAIAAFPEIRYVSTVLASRSPSPVPYFPMEDPEERDTSLAYAPPNGDRPLPWLMIPLTPCPGVRWSPFCSYLSIRRPADPAKGAGLHGLTRFEALWRRMLTQRMRDGFASVYFDPMDVMRDAETAGVFARMLGTAARAGWSLTTLEDVRRAWSPVLGGEA